MRIRDFSKTDPDATFMRMKEDHMRNGQLKPGYYIQSCRIFISDFASYELFVSAFINSIKTGVKSFLYALIIKVFSGFANVKNLSNEEAAPQPS